MRDPEVKAKLADTLNIWPDNRAIPAIRSAPVVIAACAELGKSGYHEGKPATDKGDWFMFDVALAMQNLVLAAYSLGLGTVHVGFFDARKAAEILQLPEGIVIVEMIPLGYPDEEPKPKSRRELSEQVFYDKYGQR